MEEHEQKKDALTISKVTLWKTIAGILGVLLLISVFMSGFGIKSDLDGTATAPTEAQPAQPRGDSGSATDMAALVDDDDVEGDADAPVTIVEWSDYECPFCARFYEQTLGQIREEYIDTGKVKLVFRDYPLNFHANAQKAAEAAECAGEQEKYYEMHDLLFEKGVTGGVSAFKGFAKEIGLDTNEFDECLDSGAMADEIAKDMRDGQAAGIQGTPGFIINGQLVSGAQPFDAFKQVIEAELAK
ncbi:thioredoxin domain-containing protein [Candidatus Woesearchaeota archaeon]|nr:thioredoxin domain-containing protein [Candidatus Woesearchaeota archaeon]